MIDGHSRNGGVIQLAINEFMTSLEKKQGLENRFAAIYEDLKLYADMEKEIPTYGVIRESREESENFKELEKVEEEDQYTTIKKMRSIISDKNFKTVSKDDDDDM